MSKPRITRRTFIGSLAAAGGAASIGLGHGEQSSKIDRYALISRHNPVVRKLDPLSPLSVGNGEFAFTCDITGLQTFPDAYKDAMPLCTMSQWGWHTKPMPEHLKGKDLRLNEYETYGRKVGYMTLKTGQEELFDWLRENPHRLHLGQIGFRLTKSDGTEAKPSDIAVIEQKLDLWTGIIRSSFRLEGVPVAVRTSVHPKLDLVAVSVESPLVNSGRLAIRFAFPYGSQSMPAADWIQPDKHRSRIATATDERACIRRNLDDDEYFADIRWTTHAKFTEEKPHHFVLSANSGNMLDLVARFSFRFSNEELPSATAATAASEINWRGFWSAGGAVDLSGSRDPRSKELERRVVLSQYLTAIQCSGTTPPQETGLTTNSWYGKFHLEMHWWHAAQFALWNRFPLLERSLDWYNKVLPSARERARHQGYQGARWAKMTDPSGRDSPSPVGTLLIWQQPHPIFYAELAYVNKPTKATLQKYQAIVQETAEWMADYAHFDSKTNRYVLGPPFIPAQENHPARETWNATYELEYWRYGLKTASSWRQKLGQPRVAKWDDIIARLSKLPVGDAGEVKSRSVVALNTVEPSNVDTIYQAQEKLAGSVAKTQAPTKIENLATGTGVYWAHENAPNSFTERNRDHPSMLAALGVLRGEMVDRETMRRTLKKVMEVWDWPTTWGWDYPMIAMTAARLGETRIAIDALLIDTPKNKYSANGHNYQRPNLPLYLPGNGGLLYAIALMANGWKGSPNTKAPGFPADGSWTVRAEGFNPEVFKQI